MGKLNIKEQNIPKTKEFYDCTKPNLNFYNPNQPKLNFYNPNHPNLNFYNPC